jgi:methylmalonyl-CoA mutase N-terminal domain/subunit
LALPTEKAARLALRTQQVVAFETGVAHVADPLGGSHYVEWMTDEMERRAEEIFDHLDRVGGGSILEGVYRSIDDGWFTGEIADAAYGFERKVNSGRRVVVGVNRFTEGDDEVPPILSIGPEIEELQLKRLAQVRQDRDSDRVAAALDRIRTAAAVADHNLVPDMIDAVRAMATVGEIVDALADVFGRWTETPTI